VGFVPNLLEGLLLTYRDTVTVARLLRVLFLIFWRDCCQPLAGFVAKLLQVLLLSSIKFVRKLLQSLLII
jgi:hypothetical protein